MNCECATDGYCQRYSREMHGRMRELCRGINVDIGTAATFRLQWLKEAKKIPVVPRKLLLKTSQSPGDAVCMTAAIYSLHKAFPRQYITNVESPYPEFFAPGKGGDELQMNYPAIHDCNTRGIHFMQGWCEFLSLVLDINIPLLTNRPHLPGIITSGDYWVICSGGKTDFTNKIWPYYQQVVDASNIKFIQVGLDQKPLKGCISLIGQTTLQQLMDIVAGAKGVLCGISLLMHLAAAYEKPAIVIAGGREPVQWNAYPKQHYIHTIGQLDCCESGGCWKSRVVPLGDNAFLDSSLCKYPIDNIPKCMTLISSSRIIELVREFS